MSTIDYVVLFAIAFFVFNMGAMLQGAGKVTSVASGNMISSNGVVIAIITAFCTYYLLNFLSWIFVGLIILLAWAILKIG